VPAFPSEPGCRHEVGWGRGNAPAGHGGGRKMHQILLSECPPAPDHQGGDARRFSRQLQAARSDEAHARDLADNSGKALLAQAFLDERQNLPFALGFGIDHPIGMQAGTKQSGGEQVATRQAPEHRSLEAGGDPGGEQGRAAGKLGSRSRLDHLVQSASGEAASRQVAVEGFEAKGQRLGLLRPTVQPGNLEPQSGKPVLLPGMHDSVPIQICVDDVPIMFSLRKVSNHTQKCL